MEKNWWEDEVSEVGVATTAKGIAYAENLSDCWGTGNGGWYAERMFRNK